MTRRVLSYLAVVWSLLLVGGSLSWSAEAEKPKPSLGLVAPSTSQPLSGVVEFRLKPQPEGVTVLAAYLGLGGAPYVPMKPHGESGEWRARIDTRLHPNGAMPLIALAQTPEVKRVEEKTTVTLDNPYQCYLGDIHSHTYYSDGTLIPAEAHRYARRVAKLDFFILTDHMASVDEREWVDMRDQAQRANQDGVFVAIPGLEWSGKGGHCCLLDPPGRLWPTDLAAFYKALSGTGTIGMFNHPGTRFGDFNAFAFPEVGDATIELMEVRAETEEAYYIQALNGGWQIGAAGTDDTHSPNWGNAGRWTGIMAPGLSRLNVWEALRRRHCYSTLDRNCRLDFRVNGAIMGDAIAEPAASAKAVVTLTDPDKTDLIAKVELLEDGKVIRTVEPKAALVHWESEPLMNPGKHYYFVKVTQADGQKMWSAPVWVTVTGG